MDFELLLDNCAANAPAQLQIYFHQLVKDFPLMNYSRVGRVLQMLEENAPLSFQGQAAELNAAFERFEKARMAENTLYQAENEAYATFAVGEQPPTIREQLRHYYDEQWRESTKIVIQPVNETKCQTEVLPSDQLGPDAEQDRPIPIEQFLELCDRQNQIHHHVIELSAEELGRKIKEIETRTNTTLKAVESMNSDVTKIVDAYTADSGNSII